VKKTGIIPPPIVEEMELDVAEIEVDFEKDQDSILENRIG